MIRDNILQIKNLSFKYGKDSQVLKDLNLQVPKGVIYGFLGPNGSGKTTTLSILLGLLKVQKGEVKVFNQDISSHRIEILKRTGSLIETPSLYSHLSARKNLDMYCVLYDIPKSRIYQLLELVGLENTEGKKVKEFSLGMKQRLALALALLPDPDLLILDEPVNGLDPAGIIEFRDLLKRLNKEEGKTIIFSSHLLSEVEKTATHIGILFKGKLIFQGTLNELHLLQQRHSDGVIISTSDNTEACEILKRYTPKEHESGLLLKLQSPDQIKQISRSIYESGLDLCLLQPNHRNLEQLFIDLTK